MCSVDSKYQDADTLTSKIAAWKSMLLRCFDYPSHSPALKVEHVIRRPDGLGTGNAHRGGITLSPKVSSDTSGPNYRPIALVCRLSPNSRSLTAVRSTQASAPFASSRCPICGSGDIEFCCTQVSYSSSWCRRCSLASRGHGETIPSLWASRHHQVLLPFSSKEIHLRSL